MCPCMATQHKTVQLLDRCNSAVEPQRSSPLGGKTKSGFVLVTEGLIY